MTVTSGSGLYFSSSGSNTPISLSARHSGRTRDRIEQDFKITRDTLVHQRRRRHHHRHTIDQFPLLFFRALVPEGVELLERELRDASDEIAGHLSHHSVRFTVSTLKHSITSPARMSW